MARRNEGREISTLKRIESLRRRVQEARRARGPIKVSNGLEYDFLQRGLGLLGDMIRVSSVLLEEAKGRKE